MASKNPFIYLTPEKVTVRLGEGAHVACLLDLPTSPKRKTKSEGL